jgi:hypothetical protein
VSQQRRKRFSDNETMKGSRKEKSSSRTSDKNFSLKRKNVRKVFSCTWQTSALVKMFFLSNFNIKEE